MLLHRTFVAVALAGAALTLALGGPAEAFQVAPMVSRIPPSGPGASYRMSIKNTSATPITVEIETYRMEVDANGARKLTPEDNDLTVFPPQTVVPAGREQVVQVRYVGDAQITVPRMYLIRAAQLPVQLESTDQATSAAVKVAFNINTHLFVSPPDVAPAVTVDSVTRAPNGDVIIAVHNAGTGIASLRTARYALSAGGKQTPIDASKVQLGEVSALPPGAVRSIRIPAAELKGLTGDMTASLELQ